MAGEHEWECPECGLVFRGPRPPEECPGCGESLADAYEYPLFGDDDEDDDWLEDDDLADDKVLLDQDILEDDEALLADLEDVDLEDEDLFSDDEEIPLLDDGRK